MSLARLEHRIQRTHGRRRAKALARYDRALTRAQHRIAKHA